MSTDLILVGGGLANSLVAWRLKARLPALRLLVLEQGERLGGNHTWSFYETDLEPEQRAWIDPLVAHRWPHYDVRFPGLERRLNTGYRSIPSERLDAVIGGALGDAVRRGVTVSEIDAAGVTLDDGERLEAGAVIDGRGDRGGDHLLLGYQKFLGQEVELSAPHGRSGPVIMDATVDQTDGYRFVYTLPFGERRMLIEDTYYSDWPSLDPAPSRQAIAEYAAAQGWTIERVVREETGSLPITLAGDPHGHWADAPDNVARSGLAALLFHATTGYSLVEAVRFADAVAALPSFDASTLAQLARRTSLSLWRRQGYFRFLNRMLFRAAAPERRWVVLRRFYGLSEGLIERFYAGRLTMGDKLRILSGKPPVPILPALGCLKPAAAEAAR